jgi:hypothetical protein
METVESDEVPESEASGSRRTRNVWRWLLVASVLGSVAVLPYTYSIFKQFAGAEVPANVLLPGLAANVAIEFLVSMAMIALGLRLGRSLGLGTPLLKDWPAADEEARRRVRNSITLAIVLGIGLGAILAIADRAIEPWLPKPPKPITSPPAWAGFLASVGAGIREEIWLRLGIMTILVWLGSQVVRPTPPAAGIVWTANVLAAAFFGALHLPQAASLLGLTAPVVAFVLLGNGLAGIVFGWLYWRRGLVAAMVSHFSADFLLKAALPVLGMG